jgi:hypothetical protein
VFFRGLSQGLAGAALALLAGCGDLPHPFKGMPGANALRLAQPPPARLAIPMPTDSLLADESAKLWSGAVADGLLAQELPATATEPAPGDWRIVLSAHLDGGNVTPTYTVVDPKGAAQGSVSGPPVPASAWAAGDPTALKAAAGAEVPQILSLLTSIQANEQQSDPHSLLNRPPKLFFAGVTGAPGDGNASLSRLMIARLPTLGDIVQNNPANADFTVRGEIKTAPGATKGTMRVEIQWIVIDAKARESGRVVQINEVAAGSLDSYWGEVAEVVATEAAGGVHEVVLQASGRGSTPAAAPPPGAPPLAAPSPAVPPPAAPPKVSPKPTG